MRYLRRRWWLLLLPALALGWWLHARQGAGADIVFVSDRSGYREIYRMRGDGTGVRRLIAGADNKAYSDPSVSLDDKHLAYVQYDDVSGEAHIWMADADGANRRQVTREQGDRSHPIMCTDGKALVYCALNGGLHLYRINLDGTSERQLTFGKSHDYSPTVSSDGRLIVFTSSRSGNSNLYRINADGSGLTRLTTHPTADGSPAISPDGRWIAFASNRGGKGEIYLIDIHGRHLRRLTHETEYAGHPAFSPDGKRIAYTVRGCGHGFDYADICVINLDGRGRKVLTNNRLRLAVYARLGDNKVSKFLDLNGGFSDSSPAWVPAE